MRKHYYTDLYVYEVQLVFNKLIYVYYLKPLPSYILNPLPQRLMPLEQVMNHQVNKQEWDVVKKKKLIHRSRIHWHILHVIAKFLFSSVKFNHSVMSDSLQPHELQHARPPCPSPTPWVHSNSVYRVSDAIQPSHPLLSPSPPAHNPSQH